MQYPPCPCTWNNAPFYFDFYRTRTKWKRKRLLRHRAKLSIAKQQWMQRSVLQGNNEERTGKESYSVQKQTQCLPPSISLPCMTKPSDGYTHVQQHSFFYLFYFIFLHHYFCYSFVVGDKVNLKNTKMTRPHKDS